MIKLWIGIVTVTTVICAYVFGYAQLPTKVKTVEQKQQTLEESVQQTSETFEKYIIKQEAIQETKEKAEEEYKKLLREWIKAVSEK